MTSHGGIPRDDVTWRVELEEGHATPVETPQDGTTDTGTQYSEQGVNLEEQKDKDDARSLTFKVHERPPWHINLIYSIQLMLCGIDGPIAMAYILYNSICPGSNRVLMAELISLGLLNTGIATFLMNTVGVRLPIMQLPSYVFVTTITAAMRTPKWRCRDDVGDVIDGGATLAGLTLLNSTAGPEIEQWQPRIDALSGGLLAASLIQMVLGVFGVMGCMIQYIGPLTIVPAVTLLGISVIESFAPAMEQQWGISLLTAGLIVFFSLVCGRLRVPIPAWNRKQRCHVSRYPLFKLFPHLMAAGISWTLCYALTVTNVFPTDPDAIGYKARTDAKLDIIDKTSWFFFPYPGRWGWPTFSADMIVVMFAAIICNMLESIANYYIVAQVCGLPPPPDHAINRGIAVEGMANGVAGLLGLPYGTLAASSATGFISITGMGSRVTRQTVAVLLVLFAVVGKFGAVLAIIPDPIIGGMASITLGIIIAIGISNVVYLDLKSSRNLTILGVAHLLGLMIPGWIPNHPDAIQTGQPVVDQVLIVLLSTTVFVGSITGFLLDNLIPGTKAERGIIALQAHLRSNEEPTGHPSVYDLPLKRLNRKLRSIRWCRVVPFMPSYLPPKINWPCRSKRVTSQADITETNDLDRTGTYEVAQHSRSASPAAAAAADKQSPDSVPVARATSQNGHNGAVENGVVMARAVTPSESASESHL